jgi:hypothetical protein
MSRHEVQNQTGAVPFRLSFCAKSTIASGQGVPVSLYVVDMRWNMYDIARLKLEQ